MSELKVTGLKETITRLNRVHDTVMRNVKATMSAAAKEMETMARDFAPREEYRLEESIHVNQTRDDRRYTQFEMTMGGYVAGVNVDDYATLMHENYEDIIVNDTVDEYGRPRRQGSRLKDIETRGKYSHSLAYVGGKFLERAGEITKEKIDKRVLDVVTEGTKE